MSNILGKNLTLTLFGESHGEAIGAILDGLPGGVKIDRSYMQEMMDQRKAVGSLSTGRHEADEVQFLSGVKDGYSEGTPIALLIANTNVKRKDYDALKDTARPGHADYAGDVKYNGYEDASGGGHFSGRLTAPIVAAGAIVRKMLEEKGIFIGTHIASLHGIKDRPFDEERLLEDVNYLNKCTFAVLDEGQGECMKAEIEKARVQCDSVGGILDTAIVGLKAGVGEPLFDALESDIAKAVFSIGAVKGIAFGAGFGFADMMGSEANDPFAIKEGKVVTTTNHNGGINGGISNGMPVRFHTVIKPTPSIAKKQNTVNYRTKEEKVLEIHGRHDPAIIHRARVVVDAVTALVIADNLMERYGREYFGGKRR